jgi:hypothetical protein
MTQIVVTKDIVRRLSAALSSIDTTHLKHTDRIALIAEAFGWRADAFMHALKAEQKLRPAGVSSSTDDDILLHDLGIGQLDRWTRVLSRAAGVCVSCGCTQSGRTTTLLASSNHLRVSGRRIFHRDRVTSEVGRRGDVMLFGDICDLRDAVEALWNAQNGFLVLACSALPTPSRLLEWLKPNKDLKIDQFVGGISQRLVRKRCDTCGGDGCSQCKGKLGSNRVLVSHVESFETPDHVVRCRDLQKLATPLFVEDVARLLADRVLEISDVEAEIGRDVLETILTYVHL